ncbi:2402_t:CDS:2 [Acaulospora morrowiae]|uniref:2402_t:CDS:1 n=1 Tax=Acaulospora morrowiae TaxID=94023 RepID=A0A9N9EYU4_9GLOM|nr:2402_t:CDS:2 [Acaulospora morrowiae]
MEQSYALKDKTVRLYNLPVACRQLTILHRCNILGKLMMRRPNTVARLRMNDIVLIDRIICSPKISRDAETEIVEDDNKLMKVKLAKEQQPTNRSTNLAGETQPSDTPPPVMANRNAESKKSKMKESPSASQNLATDIQLVMKIECMMVWWVSWSFINGAYK